MFGSAMSVPSSVLSPGSAPSRGGSRVEWMDAVGGYSPRIRAHPSRLKIAVLDPLSLWKPFLQPTFASYQPFQGLQVKNKTAGALQKVEDLKAEVVNMYMREPPATQQGGAGAAGSAASTPSGSATSRARSSTSGGGIFGFGSGTPSSASGSSNSGLYVSTAADAAAPPPAFPDPASPSASSAASTLSASIPTLKHPMNWHCYPYLHILLVSPPTLEEYVRTTKGQIKRFLEYFAAPNENGAGGGSGGSSSSTPSSARGGGGSNAASTPSGSGMVVAGSSLVPELRYHSEVLIIYLPTLESERDLTNTTAGLMTSGSFVSGASSATNSGSSVSSFASLFKRSPSFSTPTAAAAALAEERAQALKASRKVYDRMRSDFGGSRDPLNNQVARIDLYEIIRQQQQAEREETAAGGSGVSGGSSSPAAASTPEALELVHQWDDLIARIVRSLIRTHEGRASLYELELKKSLTNSHMSGWNFPAYFVLKESYAMLHQQMGLRSDALRLYEELRVMCEELLQGAPDGGKSSLQYLLLSSSSPRTAGGADSSADPDYSLSSSSMPAPILDVVGKNYPLLILRGEITELEFLRYLHAQAIWIMIKINKSSSSSGGGGGGSGSGSSGGGSAAGTGSAQNYLLEIMSRGRLLILSILGLIARSPSRFSAIRPEHALAWALEAVMDLGVLCEKYLVHGYIEAYQNLTMAAHMNPTPAQAAAAEREAQRAAAAAAAARERSTGLSNVLAAVASVIGPSSSPVAAPLPAPTPAASSSSSASSSAPSLQSQARALKASHEADLRALQMLRADLYGVVLERIYLWAKAHPNLKLKGEVREIIEAEKPEAAERRRRRREDLLASADTTASNASAAAVPTASSAATAPTVTSSRPSPRIGLDDDVYTDMLEFYYPHDVDHSVSNATAAYSDRVVSAALEERDPRVIPPNMYGQFQARHKRILQCFAAASKPIQTANSSATSQTGAAADEVGASVAAAAAATSSTALTVATASSAESFTFHDLFLELCSCSLKLSALSGRLRLCTRVAEMKAVVLYGLGDYSKALDLFQSNVDRFRKEKWTQIAYPQLLMSIKCLSRLGRHEEVVRAALGFLTQHHQQIHSSRFRPTPMDGEEPFSWSRLGGMITARKKELEAEGDAAPSLSSALSPPEPPAPSRGGPRVFPPPYLSYTASPAGPSSAAVAKSQSLAVAGSALPSVVQVVVVQNDAEDGEQRQTPPAAASVLDAAEGACAPFLLDCCPDGVESAAESSSPSSATFDGSLVSPAQIQQLLLHTLRTHLGPLFPAQTAASAAPANSSAASDLLGMFQALRALAHRSAALLPMFPATHGAESPPPASPRLPSASTAASAAGSSKRLSVTSKPAAVNRSSSLGTAHHPQAIVVDACDVLTAATATVLPAGPYIESSLHPFFVLRNPALFLYRKTHPLHAVIELDVESRLPQAVTLDALAIVIQLERHGNDDSATTTSTAAAAAAAAATAGSSPLQSTGLRRQMSVIVTPPTGLLRPAPIRTTSGNTAMDATAALQQPHLLPSPLPSQSLSASNSLENLSTMHKRAGSRHGFDDVTEDSAAAPVVPPLDRSENNSPASPAPAAVVPSASPAPAPVVLSASPDPVPSAQGTQPASGSVSVAASPTSCASQLHLPSYAAPEEWECCFPHVTLQPGSNRLYLHVFHSVLEPEGNAVQSGVTEHAGSSSSSQHHSIVLYHSHAQLEHIHALFEASHAHMQQVVEQRRRMSLAGGGGSAAPGHSRQSSLTGAPRSAAASHVHSFSSTSLSLRDVWFGIGRLQMWHLDLAALNAALQTRVLTLKQRRAQLSKLSKKGPRSLARYLSASVAAAPLVDLADVDLSACADPHLQSGFVPPAVSFKPFAGKPRLSIEVLPIAPSDLLIGNTAAFHIAVAISIGAAADDSDQPRCIDKCVLHVASSGGLRLFNVDPRASTGGVRGSLSRQNSDETNAAAPTIDVFGLLRLEGSGRPERKSYSLNVRSSEIALGTLPAGATLFLLVPVAPPGHLSHLLRTKQITLPASSVANSPYPSRPGSPSRGATAMARMGSGVGLIPSAVQGGEQKLASQAAAAAGTDLHSVSHELSLDLTCASGGGGGDVAGSGPVPQPSFMFSRYSSLTFMEPLQLSASMERLGARWFLQMCLWNRCGFAVQLKHYKLELPAGFVLKNDPNEGARGYVMPPLALNDVAQDSTLANAVAAGSTVLAQADPGAAAASFAASVPVSFASPNVYSLVFELAYEPTAAEQAQLPTRRNSLSADLHGEEAELAASYTSASIGRFVLHAEPVASSASVGATSRSSLSLSWPVDIALMSGSQDLHLGLSFPERACVGRLLTLTITVLHSRAAEKRKRGRGAQAQPVASSSAPTAAAPLSLLYSVHCPPHLWLLSGKQSHAFSLAEGEQRSFSVRVLPIAAGYLPIPHVELMQADSDSGTDRNQTSVLQQAADKLAAGLEQQRQQQQTTTTTATADESSALRISTATAAAPSSSSASGPPFSHSDRALSYSSIPPSRILRHVSVHHLIHVFPSTNFATQLQPLLR